MIFSLSNVFAFYGDMTVILGARMRPRHERVRNVEGRKDGEEERRWDRG